MILWLLGYGFNFERMTELYDYLIIGSGFGGSVSALRLAEKGYSVLLLEQGKRYEPEDYAKTNWNLKKYLWMPSMGFFGILKLSFYPQASILTGIGLGGGSLVYANTLFMPPTKFFRSESWLAFGDWEKILEPFYKTAGFMMGRTLYDQKNPEDIILRKIAKSMEKENTFQNVFVGVNLSGNEQETDPYFSGLGPKRKTCTGCAACMVGCRENAKNTLDKNYLFFAEKFGAKIISERKAYKLEKAGEFFTVHSRSSTKLKKNKISYKAKNVIISGGVLGTLKFLFEQKHKYKTLPLISDKLGHNLLTNSETLTAVSGIKMKMNNGVAISSVFHPDDDTNIEIVKYPDGSNLMKLFFTMAAGKAGNNFIRILKLIQNILLHPVTFAKTVFSLAWSSNAVIFLVMQTLDNAMKMRWKRGLFCSGLKIDNRGNKRVPAYIDIGQTVTEKYAAEAGGISQNIILEVVLDRPTTAHILGGCKMSERVEDGVINPKLELHSYPGIYIIDGSVIQANPGVNPSFSILAMAEYAMSLIPVKTGSNNKSLKVLLDECKKN
jgi:cholesterol oxidase